MTATVMPENFQRLTFGARVVAAVVLGLPTLFIAEAKATFALVALVVIWAVATWAGRWRLPALLLAGTEGALVGVAAGVALETGPALLAALMLPPFVGGLRGGARVALLTVCAELTSLLVVHGTVNGTLDAAQATDIFMWVLTGVGLGLIAGYLHSVQLELALDPLRPYREAQALIRELLELSGDLGSGLDPISLSNRIALDVRNALPVTAVAVHVSRGDQLTPVVSGATSESVDQSLLDPMAARAWHEERTQIKDRLFAVPLRTDAGVVGVVSGMLPQTTNPEELGLSERLDDLTRALATTAVHLDTALLFVRLRDAATADERRRLAREMHDGVAQDIASLGYLVDALAAAPASPDQAEGLSKLRQRITDVVGQVRLSVQTLRTDVEASESLGVAVSGLARHLSDSSGIPIRVTVNERTTRLRPEVESELLRIAQEAMTNAVRHAQPSVIDVSCRVAAPEAEILVRDDGKGWGQARPDSYGLAIMRERANLIDAELEIRPGDSQGTVVTVRLPSRHVAASRMEDTDPATVFP